MTRRPFAIDIADIAVAAAMTVDEVNEVTAGPGGYGATYGPGRRVEGIQVRRDGEHLDVDIGVSLRYPSAVSDVGETVRERVTDALQTGIAPAGPVVVTVRVVDVVTDAASTETTR